MRSRTTLRIRDRWGCGYIFSGIARGGGMTHFGTRTSARGPVKGVILDWAGTTIDYGCFAPVEAFQRAFERLHVPITIAQARTPMGLAKKDHIRTITRMEDVARAWQVFYRRTPTEADVDDLYVQAEL